MKLLRSDRTVMVINNLQVTNSSSICCQGMFLSEIEYEEEQETEEEEENYYPDVTHAALLILPHIFFSAS